MRLEAIDASLPEAMRVWPPDAPLPDLAALYPGLDGAALQRFAFDGATGGGEATAGLLSVEAAAS